MIEGQLNSLRPTRWSWPLNLGALQERFLQSSPFPHIVLDDIFDARYLARLYAELPDYRSKLWTHWGSGGSESCSPLNSKRGISSLLLLGEEICHFLRLLNSEEFLKDIRLITREPSLSGDHTFNGGGVHCTGSGGRLRIHTDRVRHPRPASFDQSINLILFINPHWRAEFGGELEFWSKDAREKCVSIIPMFNRLVLFRSDRQSFHGHPEPLHCPDGMYRTSIAVYYYTPRRDRLPLSLYNEIDWIE
jgi:hypothetical protein